MFFYFLFNLDIFRQQCCVSSVLSGDGGVGGGRDGFHSLIPQGGTSGQHRDNEGKMVKTQGPHGKSSPDVTDDQMLICEEHKTTFGWCCSSLIELALVSF